MADAQQTLLELFYGRWRSQTLYAGVKLGVFEVVGDEPLSFDHVARDLGIDSALGYRLLRALAALGVLRESTGKSFSSTPAGQMLRADHPQSMRDAFLLREGPEHTAVWKHLPDIGERLSAAAQRWPSARALPRQISVDGPNRRWCDGARAVGQCKFQTPLALPMRGAGRVRRVAARGLAGA